MAKYLLMNGQWSALSQQELSQANTSGRFVRSAAQFRHWITRDGSSGYKAEANRYHLYISLACPWASRVYLFLKLKHLEQVIGLSIVHPHMGTDSWTFADGPGVIGDSVNGVTRLWELYVKADPNYTGRVTVPVLWDKHTQTIVNNESSEIIRMFNSEFSDVVPAAAAAESPDYYPEHLRASIDAINDRVYPAINNGVYRAGFATTQAAYEEAVVQVFAELDYLEQLLSKQRYLVGDTITEADWRLFTTLVRFDSVYVGHFKCNLKRLVDYPNVWAYTRDLYQHPLVASTVDFWHIKQHYYWSHTAINPTQVVPVGPIIDWNEPHNRDRAY